MEKKRLQAMAEEYDLHNIQFQPFVSEEDYPFLVREADVGLVFLSSKSSVSTIPGKLFGFMASSIPIVAFLNRENDGHELIRRAQCGYSVIADKPEKGAELIRKIFKEKDRMARYGKNGYNYVVAHFSKKACIDQLEQLIT